MANEDQLNILRQGVKVWNAWRREQPEIPINLREADLEEANLRGADLSGANLSGAVLRGADLRGADLIKASLYEAHLNGANLSGANLTKANLAEAWLGGPDLVVNGFDLRSTNFSGANLTGIQFSGAHLYRAHLSGFDLSGVNLRRAELVEANLSKANLSKANLRRANLIEADLTEANLIEADLTEANLSNAHLNGANLSMAELYKADLRGANLSQTNLANANLTEAILIRTNLIEAKLNNCRVYGISAWDINLTGSDQKELIITPDNAPTITVDNLKIAQFLYLLFNNAEIRDAIDTISRKVVLILGRFTLERKLVLDALRDELRKRNYLPVLFDFDKPATRDITEIVSTLAHLARFVIADITDAKSIPQELMRIVPALPSVPVQPLLLSSQNEYGMFEHFERFPWVLDTFFYENFDHAIASLAKKVINPVESWMKKQIK